MKNDILTIFVERMQKIGVEVELLGNYPWIYLNKINGKKVLEEDYYLGNHGFTIAWTPIRNDQVLKFTDIGRIFKLIRKYV